MISKKVAIMAPTGMLGSMVYEILKDKFDLVLIYRNPEKIKLLNKKYGGVSKHKKIKFDLDGIYQDFVDGFSNERTSPGLKKLTSKIGNVSAVINCAGMTKPNSLKDTANTLFINGALPNILSQVYKERLVHITTDCVFDGIKGAPYDENSKINPNDFYGLSKSLGEPKENSLVLRTSIIGPEIDNHYLFIEWSKKQAGKTIYGFSNHKWNGITTKQYALICEEIIRERNRYPKSGLFHIFSNTVSKYEMLLNFREKYNVDCKIKKNPKPKLDRRLATVYKLNEKLKIPSFKKMLEDLPQ